MPPPLRRQPKHPLDKKRNRSRVTRPSRGVHRSPPQGPRDGAQLRRRQHEEGAPHAAPTRTNRASSNRKHGRRDCYNKNPAANPIETEGATRSRSEGRPSSVDGAQAHTTHRNAAPTRRDSPEASKEGCAARLVLPAPRSHELLEHVREHRGRSSRPSIDLPTHLQVRRLAILPHPRPAVVQNAHLEPLCPETALGLGLRRHCPGGFLGGHRHRLMALVAHPLNGRALPSRHRGAVQDGIHAKRRPRDPCPVRRGPVHVPRPALLQKMRRLRQHCGGGERRRGDGGL